MAVQVNQISSSIETKYPHLIAQIIDQYESGVSVDEMIDILEINTEDEDDWHGFCSGLIWLEDEGYIYKSHGNVYKYERDPKKRIRYQY